MLVVDVAVRPSWRIYALPVATDMAAEILGVDDPKFEARIVSEEGRVFYLFGDEKRTWIEVLE